MASSAGFGSFSMPKAAFPTFPSATTNTAPTQIPPPPLPLAVGGGGGGGGAFGGGGGAFGGGGGGGGGFGAAPSLGGGFTSSIPGATAKAVAQQPASQRHLEEEGRHGPLSQVGKISSELSKARPLADGASAKECLEWLQVTKSHHAMIPLRKYNDDSPFPESLSLSLSLSLSIFLSLNRGRQNVTSSFFWLIYPFPYFLCIPRKRQWKANAR
jgi:hypothetical protein